MSGCDVKVSVTIPVYHSAHLVEKAIESVLGQDVGFPFELLICDDASPDNAWEVLQQYSVDPRIRLFRNGENAGCALTRQMMLQEARGEYVSICDSDDELLAGNLQTFCRFLDRHPDIGVVYGDLLEVESDHEGQALVPAKHRKFKFEKAWDLKHNLVPHGGTMMRTALAREVGGYRHFPNSCDWDLWLRMAEVTSFHYMEDFLCYLYRRWPNTITRRPNNRDEIAFQIVREAVERRLNGPVESSR